jgi:acyl carrier protein phosphodiesterase
VNWLAHLRLAPQEPLLRLGNLCGDFVAGVDLATLHPDLQHGIAQHRAIDRFVDAHPVVRAARERFAPPFRRFAPVLLDVFFDHFLARDWQRYGDGAPLPQFVDGVHRDLAAHAALLPPALQQALPRFSRDGWLLAYATPDGLTRVLTAMAGPTLWPKVSLCCSPSRPSSSARLPHCGRSSSPRADRRRACRVAHFLARTGSRRRRVQGAPLHPGTEILQRQQRAQDGRPRTGEHGQILREKDRAAAHLRLVLVATAWTLVWHDGKSAHGLLPRRHLHLRHR